MQHGRDAHGCSSTGKALPVRIARLANPYCLKCGSACDMMICEIVSKLDGRGGSNADEESPSTAGRSAG